MKTTLPPACSRSSSFVAGICMTVVLLAPGVVSAQRPFPVHSSTQDPSILVTLETLSRWEKELSNWGRWGPDDQRGTLNLITPDKTRQAAALVREGETVTLQHFVTGKKTVDSQTFGPTKHWMSRVDPDTGEPLFALDEIQFSLHDGMLSHMDALCHYRTDVDGEYVIFNGYPRNLGVDGCEDLAIDRMGTSYVTRGVLVDIPLMRGVDWLDASTPICVSDLEAWEKFAGITIGSGDALLVRTGRWAKRDAEGPWRYGAGVPACTPRSCRGSASETSRFWSGRGERCPAVRCGGHRSTHPPAHTSGAGAPHCGQRVPQGRGRNGRTARAVDVSDCHPDQPGRGRYREPLQRVGDLLVA